jgi:hypothetical protein
MDHAFANLHLPKNDGLQPPFKRGTVLAQLLGNPSLFTGVCPMIKLDSGNVLLKPSHRRQLMSWLKRALRIGQRLGDFVLNITLHRVGRLVEVQASVHDSAGDFVCRTRENDWHYAMRDLVRQIADRLHGQYVQRLAMVKGT